MMVSVSPKSRTIALLLSIFLGVFGAHRFYVGKRISGFIYIFTLGFFSIGAAIDIVMIFLGLFTDKDGLLVKAW